MKRRNARTWNRTKTSRIPIDTIHPIGDDGSVWPDVQTIIPPRLIVFIGKPAIYSHLSVLDSKRGDWRLPSYAEEKNGMSALWKVQVRERVDGLAFCGRCVGVHLQACRHTYIRISWWRTSAMPDVWETRRAVWFFVTFKEMIILDYNQPDLFRSQTPT